MRSLVGSANKTIKAKNFEDLANVSKRSGLDSSTTPTARRNL